MDEEHERPDVDVLLVGEASARLGRALKGLGYRSVSAGTGEGCRQVLDREPVLAVVIDLDVDDVELRELVADVRGRQRHAATFVLASPTRSHEIVAALSHGVDSYLPVPPDADLLIDRMERFLAGALVRWQDAAEENDAELFVDDAPGLRWGERGAKPIASDDFSEEGTVELSGKPATVSREPVAVPEELLPDRGAILSEPTLQQPPPAPVSYDPANFPPQVHDAPTGPTGRAPGPSDDDDMPSQTVSVQITNPAAARSLDGDLVGSFSEVEEEALGFEEGEETLAHESDFGDEALSSAETVAGIKRPRGR
jgi:DNA-binding response OmpR family regulator